MAKTQTDASAVGGSVNLLGYSIVGKIFSILLIVGVMHTSYIAFAFLFAAMIPSLIAMVFDRTNGRFATKTISACNMMGMLPYLFEIYIRYDPGLAAQDIMYRFSTWVFVYGFALIGWLLIWLIPQFTIILCAARAEARAIALKARQNDIAEEWGEAIRTQSQLTPRG